MHLRGKCVGRLHTISIPASQRARNYMKFDCTTTCLLLDERIVLWRRPRYGTWKLLRCQISTKTKLSHSLLKWPDAITVCRSKQPSCTYCKRIVYRHCIRVHVCRTRFNYSIRMTESTITPN